MDTLVRRFIKTGIMFLFAGLAVGAWVLVRRELFGVFPHPHLVSAHTHAVQVGFVMFLILGGLARASVDAPALAWIVVLGGLGQVMGLALYFWTMWTRIRPVGSHIREANGEKF